MTDDHVTPGSLVKIMPMKDGTFAIATYDRDGICFAMKGRHFCASYGEALLHAQIHEARGYELRDMTKQGARR